MFKGGCVVLLLISASACGGSSPNAPTNFTITVSSPDSNVFFGATEQMTATASDGRELTGTWSSDDTSVATVGTTGRVTPTGAGQAHIIFTARSGQQGNKLLRALPNLNGTFGGNYIVTTCNQSRGVNLCGSPAALLPYTFNFTQSVDAVSGRFFLGGNEFDNVGGTIDLGGTLIVSGMHIVVAGPFSAEYDVGWNLNAPLPNTLNGTFTELVKYPIVDWQANITGSIIMFSKTASILYRALPLNAGRPNTGSDGGRRRKYL